MRRFDLLIAVFLLLQTGFAAACHRVGDVHVICHRDGIKTVYVENYIEGDRADGMAGDGQAVTSRRDTMMCCAALVLGEKSAAALHLMPRALLPVAYPKQHAPLRSTHPLPPSNRGPPAFSAL